MRVHLHGNCQTTAMAGMLRELGIGWAVSSREVHLIDPGDDAQRAEHERSIYTADIIISQPIAPDYSDVEFLSHHWIAAHKRADALLLLFPSLYFRGYHPQIFPLGLNPDWMALYHDIHVVKMYCQGVDPMTCARMISSPDWYPESLALDELGRTIAEARRREDEGAVHVRAADLIEGIFRERLLFYTFNHPTRFLLAYVLNGLLAELGEKARLSEAGVDILGTFRFPAYPSLARHLGFPAAMVAERDTVELPGHPARTLSEFIAAVYRNYDDTGGPEALRARIDERPEVQSYLLRFAQATG